MKKSAWITIVIIIIIILGFFLLKGLEKARVTEINEDAQVDTNSNADYKNLNTDNQVFEAIDESLELLD